MKALISLLFLFGAGYSQVDDILDGLDATVIEDIAPVIMKATSLSEAHYRLYLSTGILATSIIFMWFLLRHISRAKNHTSADLIAGAGLIIVVMGTLFMAAASVTTEALTAGIGLIGAVTGYVLGHLKKGPEEETPKEAP